MKGGRSLNLRHHPIRFKSYSRVLHILRSCTSPGVRLYIYPSTLYMLGLSTGLIPSSSNFPSTSKLSYYFYIINTYVRYNNLHSFYGGPGGSMSWVVGSNNSYKPITSTAWVRARLCKLQKRCTRLAAASDTVYQLLSHGRWFSPGTPASSTTKTGRHDIAEILLKVALKHQKSNLPFTYIILCR